MVNENDGRYIRNRGTDTDMRYDLKQKHKKWILDIAHLPPEPPFFSPHKEKEKIHGPKATTPPPLQKSPGLKHPTMQKHVFRILKKRFYSLGEKKRGGGGLSFAPKPKHGMFFDKGHCNCIRG